MSETFLDLNLNSYVPPQVMPDGEYQLRIEADPEHKTGPNSTYLNIRLSVVDHPEAQPIWHRLFLPSGNDQHNDNTKRGFINTFCDKFGIPRDSGISLIGWAGLTAWANLTTETNAQHGDKNVIKSFV